MVRSPSRRGPPRRAGRPAWRHRAERPGLRTGRVSRRRPTPSPTRAGSAREDESRPASCAPARRVGGMAPVLEHRGRAPRRWQAVLVALARSRPTLRAMDSVKGSTTHAGRTSIQGQSSGHWRRTSAIAASEGGPCSATSSPRIFCATSYRRCALAGSRFSPGASVSTSCDCDIKGRSATVRTDRGRP